MLGLGTGINKLSAAEAASIAARNAGSYLLDDYSGAAAAYSLRQLSSTYSGSSVKVRRASDNVEADIGFASGELDTTALASHCGASDGFVSVWYDQANSNNATQATAANQPKIYDGTTGVVTENGKAAVAPVSGRGMNTGLTFSGDFTAFLIGNNGLGPSNNTNQSVFLSSYAGSGSGQSDDILIRYYSNDYDFIQGSNAVSVTSATQPNQFLLTAKRETTTLSLGFNGGTYSTGSGASVTSDTMYLIGNTGGGSFTNAKAMQEIIIYDSAQSDANRTNIEDNINTFYSIY